MDKCSGGLDVSERALLGMLGGGRFVRRGVVSDSEADKQRLRESVRVSGLDFVASTEGLTKSSLKRKLAVTEEYPKSYDETGSANLGRRYLERSFGSWKVSGFEASSGEACVEMRTGVRISVRVPGSFQKF